MRRLLITLTWTVGAYFGSAIALGLLSGVVFFALAMFHYDPSVHKGVISAIINIAPAAVALAFLIVALRQRLPGTR